MSKTASPHQATNGNWITRWRTFGLFLLGYALLFFALAARKFDVMNSNTGDMAAIVNSFWNTRRRGNARVSGVLAWMSQVKRPFHP